MNPVAPTPANPKYNPKKVGENTAPAIVPDEPSFEEAFPSGGPSPFDPPAETQQPKALMTQSHTNSTLVVSNADEDRLEGLVYAGLDVLDALESAEVSVSLGTTYYEFNTVGETLRAVFNGMTNITKNSKDGPQSLVAACFQTVTNIYLNSGGNLVDQCRSLQPGTPIQIKYLGTERTGAGNDFKKFEVNLLRLTTGRQSEITSYWTRVNQMGLSKADANRILGQNGGNFAAALAAIEPDDIQAGQG